MLTPARPAKPTPNKSMVAGSGTGLVADIDVEKIRLSNEWIDVMANVVNDLIILDTGSIFNAQLGAETIFNPNAEFVSRFIGNAQYGAFDEQDNWQFNQSYSFMKAPVSRLQNRLQLSQ